MILAQNWKYYSYFLLSLAIILFYGKYRCNNASFKDPLEYSTIYEPLGIDGWSFSHLLFYMFIGFKYPDSFYTTMFIGILWEIFEFLNGKYKFKIFNDWGHCINSDQKIWWYGKYSDILVNMIGFLIGKNIL